MLRSVIGSVTGSGFPNVDVDPDTALQKGVPPQTRQALPFLVSLAFLRIAIRLIFLSNPLQRRWNMDKDRIVATMQDLSTGNTYGLRMDELEDYQELAEKIEHFVPDQELHFVSTDGTLESVNYPPPRVSRWWVIHPPLAQKMLNSLYKASRALASVDARMTS